jgi:hypothetical protein
LASLACALGATAQDEPRLLSLDPQPGKGAIYELSFTTTDALKSTACFDIVFPASFDISNVRLAGSSTINGGFNVVTSGDTVHVERSGLGRPIPPGEKVALMMASVRNPKEITSGEKGAVTIYPQGRRLESRSFTIDLSSVPRGPEE